MKYGELIGGVKKLKYGRYRIIGLAEILARRGVKLGGEGEGEASRP